jgi:hypothetical protein
MSVLIAAAATLLLLLPFSVRHLLNLWRSYAAKRWPKIQGTIAGAEIVTRSVWLALRPRFGVAVRYEYTVAGHTYSGSTLSFYKSWMLTRQAEELHARFSRRIGWPVDVHFDPRDPRSSVLEPGIRVEAIIRIVLWCIALFLPILLIVEMNG